MIALAENSYGKSSVRLMKVGRDGPLHTVKEWKVEILLSGNFESCFTVGDNSAILPTDTMKNTVYSRARESTAESIEDFALELTDFFLKRNRQVEDIAINIASTAWEHAVVNGKPHPFDLRPRLQRVTNYGCYVCPGRGCFRHFWLGEPGRCSKQPSRDSRGTFTTR